MEIDVSIIIPVFNAENFLRECLDSVVAQNYSSYEAIIINDGSADKGYAIINEYCKTNSKFICINQENEGVASARNTGLDVARGKYIMFLDADDALHKDTLSELLPMAFSDDIDFIRLNQSRKPLFQDIRKNEILKQEEFLQYLINDIEPMIFTTSIIKSEIISKNNIRFKTRFCEDILFNINALLRSKNIFFTQKEYYFYRSENNRGATSVFFDDKGLIFERNKTIIELFKLINMQTTCVLPLSQKRDLQQTILKYAGARFEYFQSFFLLSDIKDKLSPNTKIAIWGASRKALNYVKSIEQANVSKIVFIDSTDKKHGTQLMGYPVISPPELLKPEHVEYKSIIFTPGGLIKHYAQMKNLGLVDSFMDLRLDIGENKRYDMQLEAMNKLMEDIIQLGFEFDYSDDTLEGCTNLNKTQNVILFGAGRVAARYYAELDEKYDIIAFADSDPNKQGQKLMGLDIISPEAVLELNADVIIAIKCCAFTIIKQLFCVGIKKFYYSETCQVSKLRLLDFSMYGSLDELPNKICITRYKLAASVSSSLIKYNPYNDIQIVCVDYSKKLDAEYYYHILTCSLLITHNGDHAFINKKAIELWHGFPIKTLCYMIKEVNKRPRNSRDSQALTFQAKSAICSLSHLYSILVGYSYNIEYEKFHITGYPRNDMLYESDGKKSLEKLIGPIKQHHVVIYMPTYRESVYGQTGKTTFVFDMFGFDMLDFNCYLQKNDILFIYKYHAVELEKEIEKTCEYVMRVTDAMFDDCGMDVYEILNGTDCLISDYSSVIIDYLLIDKPIIFTPTDLEEYSQVPGLTLEPYDAWMPGEIALNYEQLKNAITNALFGDDIYVRDREKLRRITHKHTDGKSTERVLRLARDLLGLDD